MKCFQYMIDATAAFIDVNDTMKTFSFLRDIDQMMEKELEHNNNTMSADSFSSFVITEEEKAKIECLKGQVKLLFTACCFMCSINILLKCKQ